MAARKAQIKDFRLALAGSPVTVFFLCSEGIFTWFENTQSVWASKNMLGERFIDVLHNGDVAAAQAAFEASEGPDDPRTVTVRIPLPNGGQQGTRMLKLIIRRILNEKGERRGALCSSIDITEEMRSSETQRVLLLEVAHRTKNMLAMVLSIAAQTARSTHDVKGFMRRFSGRVQSISKSQDAVTAADWNGVKWTDLVAQQVTAVVPTGCTEIEINGDDAILTPNGATHIGLALHELVTSSLTHGALSKFGGHISIKTQIIESDGELQFQFTWDDCIDRAAECEEQADDIFSTSLLTRIVPTATNGQAQFKNGHRHVFYELTVGAQDFQNIEA